MQESPGRMVSEKTDGKGNFCGCSGLAEVRAEESRSHHPGEGKYAGRARLETNAGMISGSGRPKGNPG